MQGKKLKQGKFTIFIKFNGVIIELGENIANQTGYIFTMLFTREYIWIKDLHAPTNIDKITINTISKSSFNLADNNEI